MMLDARADMTMIARYATSGRSSWVSTMPSGRRDGARKGVQKSNDCARPPPDSPSNLVEARREIEIAALELENATLKKALAHERKEHAEAKTRAAKAASAFEETVKAQATIPGLLQRVRDLEEKLVYERLRKSATANPSQAGKNAKSVNARRMPFSQAIALILLES